jgi:simple sugar transport system ATP-binding protein
MSGPPSSTPLLRCLGISKFFGGVKALDRISLDLVSGEILALVGDNGAGKSTLVRILSGLHTPDLGELQLEAQRLPALTPRSARDFGIETVHQHLNLCDNLGAAANVLLGREPIRFRLGPLRFLDQPKAVEEARRRIHDVGADIEDLLSPVRRLSGGQRQAIAIARALVSAHRLVMLDEPTAALGVKQTRATLDLIRRVARQGVAVILISHRLDEVFAVADRIVALRQGQVTLDTPVARTTREQVVAAMTGMEFSNTVGAENP